MTVATGILLFFCAMLCLLQAMRLDGKSGMLTLIVSAVIHIAVGVLGIVSDSRVIQISIGVLLAIWTVVALWLLIAAASIEGLRGLGALVTLATLLFFAWVTTFMVLQFAIVV